MAATFTVWQAFATSSVMRPHEVLPFLFENVAFLIVRVVIDVRITPLWSYIEQTSKLIFTQSNSLLVGNHTVIYVNKKPSINRSCVPIDLTTVYQYLNQCSQSTSLLVLDWHPDQYSVDTWPTLNQQLVKSQLSVNQPICINWKLVDRDVNWVLTKGWMECWSRVGIEGIDWHSTADAFRQYTWPV